MRTASKQNKRRLGQFMTTRYRYILDGMHIPPGTTHIIEPFCGRGDLLAFIHNHELCVIQCYDIDPQETTPITAPRDSLLDPPEYSDAFILTNPPYLARNKAADKRAFDKYGVNDLYKCFLKNLAETNPCAGGIVIVPLNFWCSVRAADVELRARFLNRYTVLQINVFEERVFDDTSSTVCAFHFARKRDDDEAMGACVCIPITVFPSRMCIYAELRAENRFLIGGDIYTLPVSGRYRIWRRTADDITDEMFATRIRAKCIDDSARNCIALEMVDDIHVYIDTTPRHSARTYAALSVDPPIDETVQEQVVVAFNMLLNTHREQFRSLFMSNFRESKDVARKRITFDLVYRIVGHVLDGIVPV
jgi:hypothetical protein